MSIATLILVKALMGQPIGILFETEDYEKQDGSIGTKVAPAAFFDPHTQLMAAEILDKQVHPQQLAKIMPTLRHRSLKQPNGSAAASATSPAPAGEGYNDIDDDIPF